MNAFPGARVVQGVAGCGRTGGERKMSETHWKDGEAGADWEGVAGLLGRLDADPVTEFDVARLRRSVRSGLAASRPMLSGFALRFAATAAAVVIGAVSLFAVLDGAPHHSVTPAADNVAVLVSRTPSGAVVFKFANAEREHRITRTTSPAPGAFGETKIARGRTYVDVNGHPQPGQVVFYRID